MTTITIRQVKGGVELDGIQLADAQDIFRGAEVDERYGVVIVSVSIGKARTSLRDAGYKTRLAE